MRASFATNRTVVSQLLAPYGRQKGGESQHDGGAVSRHLHVRYALLSITVSAVIFGMLRGVIAIPHQVVMCLIGAVMLAFFAHRYFQHRAERWRREAIDRDLPAFLTTVASSVRAGIDPIRAICDSESYFAPQSPFVPEIRKVKDSIAQGQDEAVVIRAFFESVYSCDLELFKQCLVLSRQLGGSLAEPLHRVVRVVRNRQSFRRKTRAALAMHRMSALGIALCAVIIVGMQLAVDSSRVVMTIQHPVGKVLLGGGVALITIGVFCMLRMGREEQM
jgi:Flp pilus assembly protein TadB